MVLPRSPDMDATLREPHTAISRFELMEGDQVTDEIDVQDFTVSLDAKAAQLRSLEVTLPGEEGNIPASLADKLAPGGTRARASRGVRVQNIVTIGGPITSAAEWTPTTEYGVLNSVISEPDGAITLGYILTVPVEQATEQDSAHPIVSLTVVSVPQALEQDTAGAVTTGPVVGTANEADTAQPVAALQLVPVAQAAETDTAGAFTSAVVLGQPSETDEAQPIGFTQFVPINQAVETDTAGAFTSAAVVGQAAESDTANAVTPGSVVPYPSEALYPSETLFPGSP